MTKSQLIWATGTETSLYLGFDVSMENLPVVDVLEGQADLDKPVEDLGTENGVSDRVHLDNHDLSHMNKTQNDLFFWEEATPLGINLLIHIS